MKISKHFTQEEITCKCGCGLNVIAKEVLDIADDVRDFINQSITPTCGCRCESHNKAVGGKDGSFHLPNEDGVCRAMDLPVPDPMAVFNYLKKKYPNKYGFGCYVKKGFVHVDCRNGTQWRGIL